MQCGSGLRFGRKPEQGFRVVYRPVGDQVGSCVPGLPAHAARPESLAVQPLVETPLVERIGACQRCQPDMGCLFTARFGERGDPQGARKRPDSAVVVLPREILAMTV